MNTCTSYITRTLLGMLAIAMGSGTAQAAGRPSIADLQAQIATLQTQVIPNMAGYVTMDVSNPSRPTLRVAGANLQVVNGLGSTPTWNGLGNVIVGYDEARSVGSPVCSLGQYADQASCTARGIGGVWAVSHKSGSHNLVIGEGQAYSSHSGLVVGYQSVINGTGATVLGGIYNIASGASATVGGGQSNTASGYIAGVGGGYGNVASNNFASVSGGDSNTASGPYSSVSAGYYNIASGSHASVSGGENGTASGAGASVSAGQLNNASGGGASVNGGYGNAASGDASSVSGGFQRSATGIDYWVGGALHSP